MLYGIMSPLSDDEPSVRKDFWQVSDDVKPGAEYDSVLYNCNEVNNERRRHRVRTVMMIPQTNDDVLIDKTKITL
jgi:hypothetical protein